MLYPHHRLVQFHAEQDIQDECQEHMQEAYVGNATIWCKKCGTFTQELCVTHANSYQEAVGIAFIQMKHFYPAVRGYVVRDINIEHTTTWVKNEYDS